ncbi:MAG: hypothetical protein NVS2B14_11230 [Chamaesiphon sp.]
MNDVLAIAKAEERKLEFNPVPLDLEQFCSKQHTINFIQNRTEAGDSPNNVVACMDEKLLRHIFSNLLSNAIKYSPSGSAIKFQLLIENGTAIFNITDSGIGIPLEDRPRLFESSHRATNVGSIPGTGLGLAIVKNSCLLHGGSISVQREIGQGTTFTVVLPLNYETSSNEF